MDCADRGLLRARRKRASRLGRRRGPAGARARSPILSRGGPRMGSRCFHPFKKGWGSRTLSLTEALPDGGRPLRSLTERQITTMRTLILLGAALCAIPDLSSAFMAPLAAPQLRSGSQVPPSSRPTGRDSDADPGQRVSCLQPHIKPMPCYAELHRSSPDVCCGLILFGCRREAGRCPGPCRSPQRSLAALARHGRTQGDHRGCPCFGQGHAVRIHR